MQCPKCNAGMEVVVFQGFEVDRCVRCKGLWFDRMEKEDLMLLEGAGSIDVGDDEESEYNELVFVECPKCYSILDQVEHEEPYIKYEFCRTCHGSFFDAGEFRALVETRGGEKSS